ncbi:MAG: two-component regulator propeller domain-containing protein [Bacteroidales bacterium]
MSGNEITTLPLCDRGIQVIKADMYGNIWIGTDGKGIYVLPFDSLPSIENFIKVSTRLEFSSNDIMDFCFYEEGKVIIGDHQGLSIVTFEKDLSGLTLQNLSSENSNLPLKKVSSILQDENNGLWLLGFNGIAKTMDFTDPATATFEFLPFTSEMTSNFIHNLIMDKEKTLWGAYDYGLFRIENGEINSNFSGPGYEKNLINTLISDSEGNIWFGTSDLGVFKYPGDKFMMFDSESGLQNNIVTSIIQDREDNIWVSTEGGIAIFNGTEFSYLTDKNGLVSNSVDVLFEDSYGNIWLGYYTEGPLLQYNPERKTFRKFTTKDGLISTSVLTINEDKDGNIWFATLGYGVSCYSYPKAGKPESVKTYTMADGLCSNNFWIIHKDQVGNLWFGSDKSGLMKYDGQKFIIFNEQDGLTNPSPAAITHDSENNLWIGSIGGGVFKFDGEYFTNYTINDGLSSDSPFSIQCDNYNNVWVGTNTGIDKLEPGAKTFKHLGKEEGFLGIENNQNAILKDNNGCLWFGTMNGVVKFDPSKDVLNTQPPTLVIDDIKLFFNAFDYNDYADIIDPLTHLPKHMVFRYKNNHLTFEYIGITQVAPAKVRYQYKLENFDNDWNPVTNSRLATYTNIPPGKYTFLVKSKNADGFWNEEPLSLKFTILPPLWQKTWFQIVFILFIGGLVYLFFLLRLKTIKDQKIKLEKLVDKKTIELKKEAEERKTAQLRAEQADKLKTAFLANMSHEIRTPVNAIVGFSDLLRDKGLTEEDKTIYLNYITSGGKTLLTLINDIIDISKIEAGQITIAKESCNITQLMTEIFYTFHELLKRKGKENIELRIGNQTSANDLIVNTDPHRLKQVISNLINNAVKFTLKGSIEFGYKIENSTQLVFYVKDTGIGIPADKHEIIFQRFRQVEESFTRNYEGTGLGLAISKKLVGLMDGKMWLESIPGKGSAFYFSIPFDTTEEIKKANSINNLEYHKILPGKKILVVEDEDSNFLLIKTILQPHNVELLRAADGMTALELYKNNKKSIDAVLMDIKIPGLNGYETTREIKSINNNVPVIAQTAYALSSEKDKCFAVGCDDYISKPYNKIELLTVLARHLEFNHAYS